MGVRYIDRGASRFESESLCVVCGGSASVACRARGEYALRERRFVERVDRVIVGRLRWASRRARVERWLQA